MITRNDSQLFHKIRIKKCPKSNSFTINIGFLSNVIGATIFISNRRGKEEVNEFKKERKKD